jgi:hypothetical protein
MPNSMAGYRKHFINKQPFPAENIRASQVPATVHIRIMPVIQIRPQIPNTAELTKTVPD